MTSEMLPLDRSKWPSGPWDKESDKIQWTTEAGYPGLIVRGSFGNLCGYAAVPKGHPLHGRSYGEIELDVEVHGGLTYSGECTGTICHVPEAGEPDDVWWFGFDCAHGGDVVPAMLGLGVAPFLAHPGRELRHYRTVEYLRREVEKLARQLKQPDQ